MSKENILVQEKVRQNSLTSVNFSALFVALAVALPWVAHQFNMAGPVFLPMHIFVLVAGLTLGWQAGLTVGILTPLISYLTSGMPMLPILPQVVVEVALYGLIAGLLRSKLKMNVYVSLVLALLLGRIGLFIGITLFNHAITNQLAAVWGSVAVGWPGIVIQLVTVPALAVGVSRYLNKFSQPPEAN